MSKVDDERIISANGLCLPSLAFALALWIVECIADAPHFREQGDVGAHGMSAATKDFSFGLAGVPIMAAADYLQQSDFDDAHRDAYPPACPKSPGSVMRRKSSSASISSSGNTLHSRATSRTVRPVANASLEIAAALS